MMTEDLSMLIVMGVTGAGKSHFINKLVGKKVVEESNSLHGCTQKCQLVPATIAGHKTLIIDTPGFDDGERSDTEILAEIANVLTAQYELGVQLKGIVYLHRITDVRYQKSSVKTLRMFQKICGSSAMKNVMLSTTRWSEIDLDLGSIREKELKEDFWAYMIHNGSKITRFYGDQDSAMTIAGQLVCKDTVVLDLQRELSEEGLTLNQTAAGQMVGEELGDLERNLKDSISELDALKKELRDNQRAMRLQIQSDWQAEMQRLKDIQQEQVDLEQPTANNVRKEINKRRGNMSTVMGLLPLVLSILGAYIGVPPKITAGVSDFIAAADENGGFGDIFSL